MKYTQGNADNFFIYYLFLCCKLFYTFITKYQISVQRNDNPEHLVKRKLSPKKNNQKFEIYLFVPILQLFEVAHVCVCVLESAIIS